MCGHTQDVEVAVAHLEHEQDVEASQGERQSTWKKSTASMLVAWVCRNCRQLVSVCPRVSQFLALSLGRCQELCRVIDLLIFVDQAAESIASLDVMDLSCRAVGKGS